MKTSQIKNILSKLNTSPSKWELDTILYHDRLSNTKTLTEFLTRIQNLQVLKSKATSDEQHELTYLLELLEELDDEDVSELLNRSDEQSKDAFIEDLARTSAIEILTGGKILYETMNTACKLSPSDFIMCAKRTQDLLNAIQGLVIKGETLSKDVAGA
jgi:benzoyl-CoA reductase/2-hydroxyglutaryl-CoA dehydratase subunit BcrC/BadD/HgdB